MEAEVEAMAMVTELLSEALPSLVELIPHFHLVPSCPHRSQCLIDPRSAVARWPPRWLDHVHTRSTVSTTTVERKPSAT